MQSVFRLTERNSSPFLRFSLAIVFAWYGALKLINPASAIHLLHVSVFSFLASPVCVYILGSAEVIVGLLLAFGLWVRYASLLALLILLGPLTIFLTSPALTGFPQLTLLGEFLLKDLVLGAAALSLVAASAAKQRQVAQMKKAHLA